MKTILNIGGVPEHFNLPWHLAIESGDFERQGIHLQWKEMSGGTGEMAKALANKELDLAIMLTEGAVANIATGNPSRIIALYVESPLRWGVHISPKAHFKKFEELEGKRFAISRLTSGSHLIAALKAKELGWQVEQMNFVSVGNLSGALKAFEQEEVDVFLWEKFTTKPYVDQKLLKNIGQIPTPWSCFVTVARKEIIDNQLDTLKKINQIVQHHAAQLSQNPQAVKMISERYGLLEADAEQWFGETRWSSGKNIDNEVLDQVIAALIDIGILTEVPNKEAIIL